MQPLFVDVYEGDLGGKVDWAHLVSLGAPWHGAIIKATQGTSYRPAWFATNWRAVREAAGDRYGVDFFRGAYHFLSFEVDGAKQAEFCVKAIEDAGGFGIGDLWPIVDVERGSEGNANQKASAQQVIDCTSAFVARTKELTGRKVVLYGNGAMRDLGIHGRMGCDYLWCPRYTATLPTMIYEREGWTQDALLLWQYSGDADKALLAGYPDFPPGFKHDVDVSVLVKDGGLEWLRATLWAEKPAGTP